MPVARSVLKAPYPAGWLHMKADELRRIAVLLGTECSGNKKERVAAITAARQERCDALRGLQQMPLSLISIDMGIRNLAFAHLAAARTELPAPHGASTEVYSGYATPSIEAWQRLSISCHAARDEKSQDPWIPTSPGSGPSPVAKVLKESFEPAKYAAYAYRLVHSLLAQYNPTHVLIERQRFRSGGSSAVQEWTIRVGVFEGMLYAALKSIAEERGIAITVQGVLPTKVNRYWFEEGLRGGARAPGSLTGSAVKAAKIEMVASMLREARKVEADRHSMFHVGQGAEATAGAFFREKSRRAKKDEDRDSSGLFKLDDVADCLLQGLAWIDWHNNTLRVETMGLDAFNM